MARPFRHEAESRQPDLRGRHRARTSSAASSPTPSACSRCSRTCCPTPSSSPQQGGVKLHGLAGRRAAGARTTRCSSTRPRWSPSRCPTPASAFRPKSRRSSSRPSSRPTPAPAANTAAPASASRSAANSPTCSAARSSCAATPGVGSTFTLYLPLTYVGAPAAARPATSGAAPALASARRRERADSAPAERPIEPIVRRPATSSSRATTSC